MGSQNNDLIENFPVYDDLDKKPVKMTENLQIL